MILNKKNIMKIIINLASAAPIWDLDLSFWLNDDVHNRHFRNCSNNKDSFEVNLGPTDALFIDFLIYAMNGTKYIIKYTAKTSVGEDCSIQKPNSPVEGTVQNGNRAHKLITIKI